MIASCAVEATDVFGQQRKRVCQIRALHFYRNKETSVGCSAIMNLRRKNILLWLQIIRLPVKDRRRHAHESRPTRLVASQCPGHNGQTRGSCCRFGPAAFLLLRFHFRFPIRLLKQVNLSNWTYIFETLFKKPTFVRWIFHVHVVVCFAVLFNLLVFGFNNCSDCMLMSTQSRVNVVQAVGQLKTRIIT